MISDARAALRRVRRVLIQAPTGFGKTVLASYISGETAARSQSVWFLCHRAELVEGTSKTFHKHGRPHGIIAAGYPMSPQQLVQVCSIQTLVNRLDTLKAPRVAIVDECHHCGAETWAKVIRWLQERGVLIIGLSATPWRMDGQGLIEYFDEMVLGPQPGWLMDQGHLADWDAFAPPPPKGLKASGGDDGRGAQAKILDRPKLTGDVVEHWRRHANGMRTVGFACNIAHSQHMVEAFNLAGIPAAHLDGGTKAGERRRIIGEFAAGKIVVLWNVSLFGEGFDLAAIAQQDVTIDCVILNRKTASLSLYLQMVGRALRAAPGKVAMILDHAGNMATHGYPDDEREWTLEGRPKGKAANDNGPPPPVICEGCFNAIRRPLPPDCPHCGKRLVAEAKEIKVAEGDLVKIEKDARAQERRKLQLQEVQAKSLDELVALGKARGYKFPMKWAQHKYGAQAWRRKQDTAADAA